MADRGARASQPLPQGQRAVTRREITSGGAEGREFLVRQVAAVSGARSFSEPAFRLWGGRECTGWLGREDSNLCISESEFAKTLRSGREHWNVRISIEVVVPHLIPKEGLRP